MTLLHLDVLGGFACRSAAGTPLIFPTRKVRALLAYLAVNAARPQRREQLAALLWGDQAEAEARANLRKTLSRLRGALPAAARDCLAAGADHIALRADLVELDALRFERLAADATPETLERAASLYRGPLLDGLARPRRGVRRLALDRAPAAGGDPAAGAAPAPRPLCRDRRDRAGDPGRLAPACPRPLAGGRPPRADPALHAPGPGRLGARPVPALPRAARARAGRRAGARDRAAARRALAAAAGGAARPRGG